MTTGTPKSLLLRARHAGFFSNVNCVLNHLRYSLGRGGIEAITVDWRNGSTGEQFPYGSAADGNLWLRFFEPLAFARHPPELRQTHNYAYWGMTGRHAYAMYKLEPGWRQIYGRLFRDYIRVKPAIVARADALYEARMAGHYRVGVHCRHPTHDIECLHRMPSLARFIAAARALLPADRSWVVVLATDYEPAVAAFRDAFGEKLIVQAGVMRAAAASDEQIHHEAGAPSVALAEQALVDALLLARCDAFVHVTSNLATAVGYMNPHSRMVYCETRLQALAGYLWSLHQSMPLIAWRGRLLRILGMRGPQQRTQQAG